MTPISFFFLFFLFFHSFVMLRPKPNSSTNPQKWIQRERKKTFLYSIDNRILWFYFTQWMHKTMSTRKFKFSRCIHINQPIYRSVHFNMTLSKQGTSNSMLYLLRDRTMNCIPGTRFTHAASFSLTMLSANFLPTQRFPRY